MELIYMIVIGAGLFSAGMLFGRWLTLLEQKYRREDLSRPFV